MSKKAIEGEKSKRKVVRTTIKAKKEIKVKYEDDACVLDHALQHKMTKLSICTILKKKDVLKRV